LEDVFINQETKDPVLGKWIMFSGLCGILITVNTIMTINIAGPLAVNISGTIKDVF